MLWLAAASGVVFFASRRIRRRSPVACAPSTSAHTLDTSFVTQDEGCADSSRVAGLAELKVALAGLVAVTSSDSKQDTEGHACILARLEKALPSICEVLQAPNDVTALAEATELLALMSPSRRGLQQVIIEAGVVPPLVRLLAGTPHAHDDPEGYVPGSFPVDTARTNQSPGLLSPPVASAPSAAAGCGRSNPAEGRNRSWPWGGSEAFILGHVLRTLVNLTSTAKFGTPVRLAILRDDGAVAALLHLLQPESEHSTPGGAADSGYPCSPSSPSPSSPGTPSVVEVSWQLAGLAAWLAAHLCSAPTGQLQLVQEGIVPRLVRLVRQARMAWTAARAAANAAAAAAAAAAAVAEDGDAGVEPCGGAALNASTVKESQGSRGADDRCDQRLRRRNRSGPLACASSAMLCDAVAAAAAAAAGGGPGGLYDSAMPFILAAMQYALMALVNITFDNSANQRTAVMAGVLTELDTLFGELLQPGVLVETRGSPGAAAGPCAGAEEELRQRQPAEGTGCRQQQLEQEQGAMEAEVRRQERERRQLLRTCCQGVAKFAVWLLAHLSSSDPDLKTAITGPCYSFVPRLLTFLMHPEDGQNQQPGTTTATTTATTPSRSSPADPSSSSAGPTMVAATAGSHETSSSSTSPSCSGSPRQQSTLLSASPPTLLVRQYAGMALVNLTCGVPSTKAAIAFSMDWPRMAALLHRLADTVVAPSQPSGLVAEAEAAGYAGPDAFLQGPQAVSSPAPPAAGPLAPVSDLLLYTVWLLQHLSLSPYAAAATDPRVIPPLVTLLAAPDPHVRLRTAAALGALCSAALPPGVSTAPSGGPASQQGPDSAGVAAPAASVGVAESHPHRAAFLAAGGVQRLLAVARAERDPHLLAYEVLCLSSSVGEDNVEAVAQAVAGGALGLLEGLLASEHAACLIPAAEAMQGLARAARNGLRRYGSTAAGPTGHRSDARAAAAVAAVAAAADHVPRTLLSRVVAVMLTHGDPRVRTAMNDALGALTSLPGVRDRYCAVFAETLRDLVSSAEVELRVIPVN